MRILWVSVEMPDHRGQGGQRRQFHQIKALLAQGHSISLLSPSGGKRTEPLELTVTVERPRLHIGGRRVPTALRRVHRRSSTQEWDAIVLSHHGSAWLLPKLPSAPVLLDVHNVMSYWHRSAGRLEAAERAWAAEDEAISRASGIMTCSDTETQRLIEMHPRAASHVFTAPLGVDPEEWPDREFSRARPRVALFGGWAWEPNRRGLQWFSREVWPRVKSLVPDAEGVIAGSGVTSDWASLPEGLEYVGRVADLASFTASATVVAVPIVNGVGAAMKFGEALASGAAVVATTDAASAQRSFNMTSTLVSDDAAEWAQWISARLRRRLIEPAPAPPRSFALTELTWRAAVEPIDSWLSRQVP